MMTRRRQAVVREKEHMLAFAEPLLAELAKAVETLEGLGFPFSLETLRIAEPQRLLPVRNVRLLRDRYTAFDLAHELGREGELLDSIAAGAGDETSAVPSRRGAPPHHQLGRDDHARPG